MISKVRLVLCCIDFIFRSFRISFNFLFFFPGNIVSFSFIFSVFLSGRGDERRLIGKEKGCLEKKRGGKGGRGGLMEKIFFGFNS